MITDDQIKYIGWSPHKKTYFYEVCGIPISVEFYKIGITENIEIRERYKCCCKDCSIKRRPNQLEPRCKFVEALKEHRGEVIK